MTDHSKYINREISWLHFNERVLQEAMDPGTPLLERLKFLGIYSNNRDEFFRVRVGTINRLQFIRHKLQYKIDFDPRAILNQIHETVLDQEAKFNLAFRNIVQDLKLQNIVLINETQLSHKQGDFVKTYFNQHIRSFVFPIMLNSVKNLTFLKDQSLYLAVQLIDSNAILKEKHAIVKVPTTRNSRFLILPEEGDKTFFIFLDDVIRYCLGEIFSILGYDTYNAYTVKFTRDAELDIDNDVSKSFLELMSEGVKKRKVGVPVRFVYDAEIPPVLLDKLMKKLRITEGDSLRGGSRYHNFKDFMHFPRFNNSDLFYKPFPPVPHPDLPLNKSIIAAIRERDLMLHFPYQSFQYIIDLLREASIDPQVKEIKMTFYRAAQDSSVINALINASRNGKMVTVFLELQARFDEEANIYWTNRLQEEGVKIIQTIPGFKVHCKLLLIRRREADDTELLYANISTGNYNEHTATVYSDDSLLTCHPGITNDVDKVFRLFESRYIPPKFKELIVAPFCIRDHIMEMLDNEIRAAQSGKEAWAIIKINSIVDTRVADKLYEASAAGVKIRMIVRGICILKGGVPGLSENIEISSIIDRFLEHSRIYVFCNKGRNKFYIGSADWMQRNFDHRIEVLCPVYDKNIQKELMTLLRYEIYDNTKSRDLSWGKINSYKSNPVREPIRSQFNKYQYFTELAIKSRKNNEKAKAAK
ncbi:MAG: polyphosphate kinase 1 [Bacteroidales bacterium]|nr:polyphosphate kinase 1 [Bacteroidales bacterium]